MIIIINSRKIELNPQAPEYAQKRLSSALKRFSNRLNKIKLTLTDINGPKGGIDKLCLIEINHKNGHCITVKSESSSLYTAIDEASGKAKRAVTKFFNRILRRRKNKPSYDPELSDS